MMKKIVLFMVVLMAVAGGCGGERETTFVFRMPADDDRPVEVELPGSRQRLEFAVADTVREAVFSTALDGGEYARVWVGDMPAVVWMEAGRPWTATLKWNEWRFEGAGAAESGYLNRRCVWKIYFTDYGRMPEEAFREKLRNVVGEREAALRELPLGGEFAERETRRLRWTRRLELASFALYGELDDGKVLSDSTMAELRAALTEDEEAWGIPEYPEAVRRTLEVRAMANGGTGTPYERLLSVLGGVTEKFRDARLVEEVVYRSVMDYARQKGMEDAKEMDSVFRRTVGRPDYAAAYERAYAANRRLFRGQPAVAFTFEDREGRRVSLSDFRGRYVFIDLWATWCGPCNAEIPALRELEREFEGRNIVFVGISCDGDRESWERFLDRSPMGGTQLFMGDDRSYMDSIQCKGIPRFLLVDREGRFVNANMSRPSDPATAATLRALPGM